MKTSSPLETALLLLERGHWPVIIKPGGKAPIGESWGSTRPTRQSIEEAFRRFPNAGVGLRLGPEAGIIDIEIDGPEGEDSLMALLGGEIVPTLGWSSARGPHHIFKYDARLAKCGKSIIKLGSLLGLELRIGGQGKQLQSNCPPTPGTDGRPREWNGCKGVANLPEAVFEFLGDHLAQPESEPANVGHVEWKSDTHVTNAYIVKAVDEECQAVATAPVGERNTALNKAAFALGTLVGAGALARSDAESRLKEAARDYVGSDGSLQAVATIKSGLDAGIRQPRDLSRVSRPNVSTGGKAGADTPAPWPPLRFTEPPEALPFPLEVFPACLQTYAHELAEATLAPTDFVGASMLVTAGAAIGQSVNIQVKRGWIEPPLLFGALVAPPGKTKTPVIRAVVRPMAEIDRCLRDESRLAHDQWEEGRKARDKDRKDTPPAGPEPPRKRAVVKDITRESLAVILADNPRGVLSDPDEATSWVASFNEYKVRGADRQFWLSIWSCQSVSVDRKGGRESIHSVHPFVSVLAGLPPDMLTSLRDERGRNDGFMDRILFVYPSKFPAQEWSEKELSPEAEQEWVDAIKYMFIQPMRCKDGIDHPHLATFSPEAKAVWVKWFNDHSLEMDSPDFADRHTGAWSKLRAHAARFALILSRLRLACDPGSPVASAPNNQNSEEATTPQVNAADVRGAILLVAYFKNHLARVSHRLLSGAGNADATRIIDWLKRGRREWFRVADVRDDLRRFRDAPHDLAAALDHLRALGVIRPRLVTRDPSKHGRPPSAGYDVHPDFMRAPENTKNTEKPPLAGMHHSYYSGLIGYSGASKQCDHAPDREIRSNGQDSETESYSQDREVIEL